MTAQQQARIVGSVGDGRGRWPPTTGSPLKASACRRDPDRDPAWPAPRPLLALGLSDDEAWAFLQELVRTLRQQGAVTMPEEVTANDEIFAPRLGPIESGCRVRSRSGRCSPGCRRGTNRRVDYVHASPDRARARSDRPERPCSRASGTT